MRPSKLTTVQPTQGTILIPNVRALPSIDLVMPSKLICFICSSVAFILAISYMCFNVNVPTQSCPGLAVPFSIPAAFFKKYEVGGVLVTNVNVRSGCTVIRVGVGIPGSMCAVRALNSLQKSMDLTPRAPSAGPTGGVGAALPAGTSRR